MSIISTVSRKTTVLAAILIGVLALGGLPACVDKGTLDTTPELRIFPADVAEGDPIVLGENDTLELVAWARSHNGEELCSFWLELFEYRYEGETVTTIELMGISHWVNKECPEDGDRRSIAVTTLDLVEFEAGEYEIFSSEGCFVVYGEDDEGEEITSPWDEYCLFTIE